MPTATAAAEDYQAGQEALVSLIPALVGQAWDLLDPADISGTIERLSVALEAIVQQYGYASAAAALDHYRRQRLAAGVTGRPSLTVARPASTDEIVAGLKHAISDLYGPVTPESVQAVQDSVSETVARLVLNQGRDTILNAVRDDRAARGWARVTESGACAFCLMLATRGAAYKSRRSASFQAHDNCRCQPEPVFGAYEPTARVRAAQAQYETARQSKLPTPIAFRRLVEGRPLT